MSSQSFVFMSRRKGCRKILIIVVLLLLTSCLASTPVEPIAIAPIDGGLKSLAM